MPVPHWAASADAVEVRSHAPTASVRKDKREVIGNFTPKSALPAMGRGGGGYVRGNSGQNKARDPGRLSQVALQMPRQFHIHLTIRDDKPPADHIGRRLL
ncbi:hypothetical protein JCM18382A_54440 [Bradyrhizobium sp. 17-4]